MTRYREQRQRVFYALSMHYSGAALAQGLTIWEQEFSHGTRFSRKQFAVAISRRLSPVITYDAVLASINHAMQLDVDELNRVLGEARTPQDSASMAAARTLAVLLAIMGKRLGEPKGSPLLKQLFDGLLKKRFSAAVASAVLHNLVSAKDLTLIRLAESEAYRVLLNSVYIVLCEKMGPVKADVLMSESIKEADRTSSGQTYSATHFL